MDQIMSEIGKMVKEQDAYLHSHSVLETLLYMNDDKKVAQDVASDPAMRLRKLPEFVRPNTN
jgi:hypothetical protein